MNKHQKEQIVSFIKGKFEESSATFIVGYRGMSVNDLQTLRKQLRETGGSLKITKMRLVKRAALGIDNVEKMDNFFKDQVGVVFAKQDPLSIAKVLYNFAKENKALSLVVGCFDGQLFEKGSLDRIAKLPSREILLSKLCGTMLAPIANLAVCLKMLSDKKSEQESVNE